MKQILCTIPAAIKEIAIEITTSGNFSWKFFPNNVASKLPMACKIMLRKQIHRVQSHFVRSKCKQSFVTLVIANIEGTHMCSQKSHFFKHLFMFQW